MTYCEICNEEVSYTEGNIREEVKIKERTVACVQTLCFCSKCKSEVFVHKVRDRNLKVIEEAIKGIDITKEPANVEFVPKKNYDIVYNALSLACIALGKAKPTDKEILHFIKDDNLEGYFLLKSVEERKAKEKI